MKKRLKNISIFVLTLFVMVGASACNFMSNNECKTAEKLELSSAVINEVEFKNGDNVSLKQECKEVFVEGQIDAISEAQKSAFGQSDVTHVVVLKMTFDKERTLDSVEIKGANTKVFSTNPEDENYAGGLTDLLDNESGEDAYCNLVLSANTKNYSITAKYSDGHESQITIEITASLATAQVES